MAKPENDDTTPEKQQTWGTWEELLLACAVHRHGTDSWNSVSSEIQKRTTNLRSLTASDCRNKYTDLKCRFTQELGLTESVAEISTVPWLEDLRKLRVDELRREVEQYDLSISSLQSKVKKLEEEREISLNELNTEIENSPDLDKIVEKKEHRRESVSEPVVPKPPITSVNGSISPDPKEDSPGTGSENAKRDEEMVGLDDGGEAKLAGEDLCRGSCEGVEKESAENSERVEPGRRTELTESMAESEGGGNGGDEGGKETSDVQSSASLPRKGTSEPENEDQSPSTKDLFPVESQPSNSFVEIFLSNPCGSHFSRRLETQETLEYSKIIREHIDLEIIRKRVEEGWYKSSMNKLFRDLLLLINNARFFYPKKTSEFNFAVQLNELVKKQITTTIKKKPKEISPPKANSCLELVPFVETVNTVSSSKPVSSKPRMSVPIVACRKRSSLATKPLPPGSDKKDETFGEDDDDKSLVSKKMTRGRTTSTKKVAIRNVKNRDSGLNVDEVKKTDEEKKGSNKSGSSKKKSAAASFLKRMRVGSSSSDTLVETLKPSSATDSSSTGKGGAEQRKNKSNNSNKAGAKKRATTTGKNQTSPVKKNNGRAMKRVAAPSSSSLILGKRSREADHEKERGSYSST